MSNLNINEDAQSGGEFSGSRSSFDDTPGTSQPTESAFPDEDEETITMLDVIEREDKLEEEASAVLGFSDEKNCTYPKGYISRQALYSCATCLNDPDKPAAICLACSLECHENHEVYELYTKRNYRCDCGNNKFKADFECKLIDKQNKKLPFNESNKYNHNFSGRYCTCDKKYPPDEYDESPESQDEMWQCIVCEDWYHTKHLNAKDLPDKFEEMICGPCVEKLDFVHYYREVDEEAKTLANGASDQKTDETNNKCTSRPNSSAISGESVNPKVETSAISAAVESETEKKSDNICESDTNDSQAENKDPGQESCSPTGQIKNECILEGLKNDYLVESSQDSEQSTSDKREPLKGPLFWSDCEWRANLCRCQNCMDMYRAKECEYLLDDKDTVQYYEAQGKAIAKNNGSPFERGMSALNRMNRAAVVEALHGYDELKADLSDYLRKFADTKKVVRESDIHEFFTQLKSKKRPKLDYS